MLARRGGAAISRRPRAADPVRAARGKGGAESERSILMSTIAPTQPGAPPSPLPVYRISVEEYERMAGILKDDRVELINGYLVRKMSKKPPHTWTTRATLDRLARLLPSGWMWRLGQPVRIPDYDEPEPDIAIVRGTNDDYKDRNPEPPDVALLVEVSDSSLSIDPGEKCSAYARGKIPVYWIINLVDRQVEVYSRPGQRGYRSRKVFKPGQPVPVTIGGLSLSPIAVNDILP